MQRQPCDNRFCPISSPPNMRLRILIQNRRGLIVEVTENDLLWAGGNPVTQSVKLALKGLALNMAAELRQNGVAAIAITPGFLRSETMLERLGVTEGNWRDAGKRTRTSWNRNRLCSSAELSWHWPVVSHRLPDW